ncbi:MAG: ABC transporter ATP-binding protein [Planctomycetes bacterium]|nr:ABC transporter ATP-binding protein [Planctomycetota bacterium]
MLTEPRTDASAAATVSAELALAAPTRLSIRGVSKSFAGRRGPVQALAGIDLDVAEGQFLCLLGPSGCGKSTLLALVAGLDFPDCGEIHTDGHRVTGPGRDRMVMFQESALFPWRTALGNVLFGLELKPGLTRAARREVARYYLDLVGLTRFAHAAIHELSGGMRQRVALARALAPNPSVLLMDEPFGALDAMTREKLYGDLQAIWSQRRKTILFVTHNVREACVLADRVAVMSPHPGRIVQVFDVALPRPRDINSERVAALASRITATLAGSLPTETRR